MINTLNIFNSLIEKIATPKGLFHYIKNQSIPIDASDLLRWEWVIVVSALDKYIHDVVRVGMIQIFLGNRDKTDKYMKFSIDMEKYINLKSSRRPYIEFENEIIRQHSMLSFQKPDKISDALSYIWSEPHKWYAISCNMSTHITEKDLKTKLNNIIVRRDQIVHQGDYPSFVYPLQQQSIKEEDVDDVVHFVTELVQAIHTVVS